MTVAAQKNTKCVVGPCFDLDIVFDCKMVKIHITKCVFRDFTVKGYSEILRVSFLYWLWYFKIQLLFQFRYLKQQQRSKWSVKYEGYSYTFSHISPIIFTLNRQLIMEFVHLFNCVHYMFMPFTNVVRTFLYLNFVGCAFVNTNFNHEKERESQIVFSMNYILNIVCC